jgi:hypothetical protein
MPSGHVVQQPRPHFRSPAPPCLPCSRRGSHLSELGPEELRWCGAKVAQLRLLVCGPHQGDAVPVWEQGLDRLPHLPYHHHPLWHACRGWWCARLVRRAAPCTSCSAALGSAHGALCSVLVRCGLWRCASARHSSPPGFTRGGTDEPPAQHHHATAALQHHVPPGSTPGAAQAGRGRSTSSRHVQQQWCVLCIAIAMCPSWPLGAEAAA